MKRLALACALFLAFGCVAFSGAADARGHHRAREIYRAEHPWLFNQTPPYLSYRGDRRPCAYRRWDDRGWRYRHDNGLHRGWYRDRDRDYRDSFRRWRDRW